MPSKPVALRRKLRPRSFRGPFGKQPIQVEHFWRCSEASEYSIKEAQASENPISEMRWLFRGHLPALFSGTTTGCESGCPGSGESTSRRRALARFEQVSTKRPSHTLERLWASFRIPSTDAYTPRPSTHTPPPHPKTNNTNKLKSL
jgi:hypothetical protein